MRRTLTLVCAFAFVVSLAGCGAGTSDNTILTGTTQTGSTRNSTPPGPIPTPTVARQDAVAGMSDRELAFASELFELVNAYRAAQGIATPLQWDAAVAAVAQVHTVDMLTRQVLTHDGPGACVNDAAQSCLVMRLGGVPFITAGENVASGFPTSAEVLAGWQASPTHNQNLLDPRWTHIGHGFKEGAGGPWWTQVFVQR